MEFKPENVYYALNATEDLIGAKGYFADDLAELESYVNCARYYHTLTSVNKYAFRNGADEHAYNFFYLVEPAPSKPKYRPFRDCNELIKCYRDNCYKKQMSPNPNNFINEWIELPTIWIKPKNKEAKSKFMIICFDDNGVTILNSGIIEFDRLFRLYTFLDGSVCGVEE